MPDRAHRADAAQRRAIRVFVLDDDPSVCKTIVMMLLDAGFVVASATTIAAALAGIPGAAPDVVLSDLQMPGSINASVIKLLRVAFPTKPIIAMSGNHALGAQALALGADDFLPKPARRAVFMERITALAQPRA